MLNINSVRNGNSPSDSALMSGLSIYNFAPENYKYSKRAIANTKSGISNTYCLMIGDSTTAGFNEISGANEVAFSPPKFLAQFLLASGMQAGWQNMFGDHNTGDAVVCDNRVSALTSGWALLGASAGGPCGKFFTNSSNQNKLQFTPAVQTDTCEIVYYDASGNDGLTVTTGAGGVTAPSSGGSIAATGTNLIKVATATTTLGTNIWGVNKSVNNANLVYVLGFNCYNSANKEINCLNFGAHGYKASDFANTSQPYLGMSGFVTSGAAFYGAPLAIINIGINDWTAPATNTNVFYANMSALISRLQAGGTDVVLVVPIPSSANSAALADQAAVSNQIYLLAATYNLAVIDITKRWVSYANSFPLSYYRAADDVHGSRMGYSDIAMAISGFFTLLGAK